MIYWAVAAAVLSSTAVFDVVARPTIRRVALRNLTHRTGEAALVVFGSALGTAIIAGAFMVGDTFDKSIRDIARTNLGPIDEVVELAEPTDLDRAIAALTDSPIAGTDGILGITQTRAAVLSVSPDPRSDPNARISELSFDDSRALGPEAGFDDAGGTPVGDELVLTDAVAQKADVEAGDTVQLFLYDTRVEFVVRDVLDEVGVAGYGEVFVEPGTLDELASSAGDGAILPASFVLISNVGTVFDSADNSGSVIDAAESALGSAGIDSDISPAKEDLLADAEENGAEITGIFTAIGGFSVLAGVLLLVNLFVMLAEERKTSLGVLRAVGWRRGHLVRSFVVEGAAYGAIAAVVGALIGIPLGWLIVKSTSRIFEGSGDDFTLLLAVEPKSLLLAGLVGFTIALSVSWVTSWRISRMNIIRAIKDLPEPASRRSSVRALGLGVAGAAIGAVLTVMVGIGGEEPLPLLIGVPVALFSILPFLVRVTSPRVPAIAIGLAAIVWALAVFSVFADIMEDPPISVFLLQGVVLVAGAVAITSSLGPLWSRLVGLLPGGGSAGTKLGLAYPAVRRFRTGVSMAMFALIVFSLTFMSVLSAAFSAQTENIAEEASAGFDAIVNSNPANPVTPAALGEIDEVSSSATVLRALVRYSAEFSPESVENPQRWLASGIDSDFVSPGKVPELGERIERFADDRSVFQAVVDERDVVIVPPWFLDDEDNEVSAGDEVILHDGSGGESTLTVAGVLADDWVYVGSLVSSELIKDVAAGEYSSGQHYVQFADGVEPEEASAMITGKFVENGAEAETFVAIVGEEISEQNGFFNLLSGYLALGLVIGVAGLSVVMVRAVRERRAQVGMLGAMGMSSGSIRSLFLTEGAFVAVQGVLAGIGLGLLSAYQLLAKSKTFEIDLDFVVPWRIVAVIALLPLVATALAIVVPARRAAAIPPAEALRLTD